MVRKFARKRRRRGIKRRRRGGKRFKRTTYDGTYFFKVHYQDTILCDLVPTNGSFIIGGGQSGTSITGSAIYLDDTAEWQSVTGRFKNWRLHGMKLKVFPRAESITNNPSATFDVAIASSPSGGWTAATVTETQM